MSDPSTALLRTLPAIRRRRGEPVAPVPPAIARLVLLPHAGGTANWFRSWGPALPHWQVLGVQYPGREDRLREPPLRRLDPLADAVVEALAPVVAGGVPTVVMGHSMGAAIAHEVVLRLQDLGVPPAGLVVSGRVAPSLVTSGRELYRADDAELLDFLRAQGGTPEELTKYPELMTMVLGILRADLELLETHQPRRARVTVPVLAMTGLDDAAASPTQVAAWREVAGGSFTTAFFTGGHFYLEAGRDEVLGTVRREFEPGSAG